MRVELGAMSAELGPASGGPRAWGGGRWEGMQGLGRGENRGGRPLKIGILCRLLWPGGQNRKSRKKIKKSRILEKQVVTKSGC